MTTTETGKQNPNQGGKLITDADSDADPQRRGELVEKTPKSPLPDEPQQKGDLLKG